MSIFTALLIDLSGEGMAGNVIEHTGIVQNVNEADHKVTVALQRVSACSACHVKSMCSVSESEQKTVEISGEIEGNYKVGEQVKVLMNNGLGMKALMIGYFIPFLVFMATLLISVQFMSESAAGLTALGIMIPYYLILMLFKGKLKNTFTFKITKF